MLIWTLKSNFSINIDPIIIKLLSLASSRWDDSNEPKIIKIWLLEPVVIKIQSKYLILHEFYMYKMPIWSLKSNFLVNINPIIIKLLPSDSFQWDEHNELKIIEIWSLDHRIIIF